jgi:hypothetical protein
MFYPIGKTEDMKEIKFNKEKANSDTLVSQNEQRFGSNLLEIKNAEARIFRNF